MEDRYNETLKENQKLHKKCEVFEKMQQDLEVYCDTIEVKLDHSVK